MFGYSIWQQVVVFMGVFFTVYRDEGHGIAPDMCNLRLHQSHRQHVFCQFLLLSVSTCKSCLSFLHCWCVLIAQEDMFVLHNAFDVYPAYVEQSAWCEKGK